MSIYLVRTILLSLFVAILVTTCYYFLREEMKSETVAKYKKSLQSWSAEFTVKAVPTHFAESGKAFKQAVDKNMQATAARMKAAGLTGEVRLKNDSTYSINISSITDTISIRNLLGGNIRLQFFEVFTIQDISGPLATLPKEIFDLLSPAQPYETDNGRQIFPPYLGILKAENVGKLQSFFSDPAIISKFPPLTRFLFSNIEQSKTGPEKFIYLYAIRHDSNALSNKYITKARSENDYVTNEPTVNFQFDAAGTRRWEKMTERNVGKAIAMCINDKVISAPNVVSKIERGDCRLAIGGTMESSRILSTLLTSEDLLLPVQITTSSIIEENLSPIERLSPFMGYLAAFATAFALCFCITWFIFKPGRNVRVNP